MTNVSDIGGHLGIGLIRRKVTAQMILDILRPWFRHLVAVLFLARDALQAVQLHQACNPAQAAMITLFAQIVPDSASAQYVVTLRVKHTDAVEQAFILSCARTLRTIVPAVIATW